MNLIKSPKSIDIEITNKCNLRCKHCYYYSSASEVKGELSTDEWLAFFEELNRHAVMRITLCGGEPFYRKDLKKLIEGIIRNRMRFAILTNGTLITDEMAAFLSSIKRCDYVQVSIDGSVPQTHDALRGEGNFEKAIQGIKYLQTHNVPVQVRATIFKKNVNELENIARLLLEEVGLPSFSTNSASHMGLCRQNAEMIQLSAEDRSQAMEILLKLDKKYNGRITAAAGPLADAKSWAKIEQARKDGLKSLPGRGFLAGCNGMTQKLAVRADGVIVPCNLLSHIELGKVNIDDFIKIWLNHPELERFRNRKKVHLSEFEHCKGCEYVNYCQGGCPGLAYTTMGSAYNPSLESCLRRFLNEGGKLPKIEKSEIESFPLY